VTAGSDDVCASAGQAVFLPGDGRAFYAGITARF